MMMVDTWVAAVAAAASWEGSDECEGLNLMTGLRRLMGRESLTL